MIPPVAPYVAIAMRLGDHPIFDIIHTICELLARV